MRFGAYLGAKAHALWFLAFSAGALAWGLGFSASFQFDDFSVIVNNPRVASLDAWWESLSGFRSLLRLQYALFAGQGAEVFRVFNWAVHVGNAVLIFYLAKRLCSSFEMDATKAKNAGLWATLLFFVHPAGTEAVTYISGGSVALATFFSLLALLFWDRYLRAPRLLSFVFCAVSLFAAMAVRETALMALFWFLLWTRYVHGATWRQVFLQGLPIFSLAFLAALMLLSLPAYKSMWAHMTQIRSLPDQLAGQSLAWVYLLTGPALGWRLNIDPDLRLLVSPFEQALLMSGLWTVLCVGLIGFIFFVWKYQEKVFCRMICLAVFWWMVSMLPSNGFLPRNDLANDRHVYPALIGVWLTLGYGLARIRGKEQRFWCVTTACIAMLWILAVAHRNLQYQSEITLWQATTHSSPKKSRPWNNLGIAHQNQGQCELAASAFKEAARLDPRDYLPKLNLQYLPQQCVTIQKP